MCVLVKIKVKRGKYENKCVLQFYMKITSNIYTGSMVESYSKWVNDSKFLLKTQ